jgi:hypothetical protein
LEKNGNITNDVKTSDMCIRQANPSIVSTRISLMAEMLNVIMNSQRSPALKDMWTVLMGYVALFGKNESA